MEEHIQDAAPYQHPNDVGMNVDWSDLGVMKKLIEKWPKGKTKPRVELFFAKINGIVSGLLCGHWITLL